MTWWGTCDLSPDGQITSAIDRPLCPAPCRKNILIFRNRKSVHIFAVPPQTEGRFAIVTDAGRDAVAAGGAEDESNDLADGEVVWS